MPNNSYQFRPVQGSQEAIMAMPYCEGYVYFATDTGKMYLDAEGISKIPLGGGGAAVLYAVSSSATERADGSWSLPYSDLEDETAVPKTTDLIINQDGSFYKVISADKDSNIIHCSRIAVSGTSSGPVNPDDPDAPVGNAFTIKLSDTSKFPTTFIYGQSHIVEFEVNAPTDEQVTVSFTVQSSDINAKPVIYSELCAGKGKCKFDIGKVLPAESGLAIKVQAFGDNDGVTNALYYRNRSVIEMSLLPSASFNPRTVRTGVFTFKCQPVGQGLSKTLTVYIDDVQIGQPKPVLTSGQDVDFEIPMQSHGVHTLRAELSAATGTGVANATPLIYELAWDNGESTEPLIWFGNYPTKINNHDQLLVEYMVYTPRALTTTSKVERSVNGKSLPDIEIDYRDSAWEIWNVTGYTLEENTIVISSGNRSPRTLKVWVDQDLNRLDFDVITSGLLVNLTSEGRSNKENITDRQRWSYTNANGLETAVTFNGFNWYSNGWVVDNDNNSCLRISNGASISIPLRVLENPQLTDPLTFEFIFKLRNVQELTTLITTSSEEKEDGTVVITKTADVSKGVFAKYYKNNIGLCLGTQEAFFKSGANAIVNARYTDGDMVHVSFVIQNQGNPPLMYIYLNGILSGIVSYVKENDNFAAEETAITFSSEYCDIDLYKFRVYNSQLSSIDVVRNYIADKGDPAMYDMNQICSFVNNVPRVEYTKVLTYNSKYPDAQTIPYAVLEVAEGEIDDLLPFVKDGKRKVNVTFVNPTLDRAYERGEITDEQYLTGSPSFTATNVPFDVQGTSSQGYPRRNYKGKFKDATSWTYLKGPLKDKSLLEEQTLEGSDKVYKHLYLDNKDASESSFTWKADYMESSMTHNTGFASFVKTLYSHHPMVDYDSSYVTGDHRTTVYGFPMMVFQKRKNGTYEFVGRYNFNLDKSCNNVIDFKNGADHPFVPGKKYKEVAQCWEFANNQHTRCSFKTVNFGEVHPAGHKHAGKLTVLDDFEYRYNHDEDKLDAAIDVDTTVFQDQDVANAYIRQEYAELEKVALWLESTDVAKADPNRELGENETKQYGDKSYTHDTVEYRLAKFTAEFTEHFNAEYCFIYFIMTELLLQYDSRGKNCMLASWGPQRLGGEYIWYPIFYDIDTQLGVNNSGVPSWEYDTEATRDNQFSTPDSILWNNLWTCFSGPIKNKYIELRKNQLTIKNLNGYYDYDYEVSGSYAMRGKKPINVINVDEYYKYIAPAFTGYINTEGATAYTSTYFYCLQGTRELHRKQFLRNRFNYLDSCWLGGTYDENAVLQEMKLRYNASAAGNTSDKFIGKKPALEDDKWTAFVNAGGQVQDYGVSPFDANANFDIKPYLKQYVSVWYDETPTETHFFDGKNSVEIRPFPSLQTAIENDLEVTQQLVYIGGIEYVSTFGDLSLKYVNEFLMNKAIRLKELILGNETPGYHNGLLSDEFFDMAAGKTALDPDTNLPIDNPYAKSLLETVVFTNISSLQSSRDLTSCEKLKTLRALGTSLAGVTLADGVPIETLYLPNTITYLSLTEPTHLTGLLSVKPVKPADAPDDYEFPKGLYIDGITNKIGATLSDDAVTKMYLLNLQGGAKMKYDSYKIAKTVVDIKKKMQANAQLDTTAYQKTLFINLKNMNWSPYRLVEQGESVIPGATYAKKTDHYTFESYTPGSTWDKDTLNGKIYQVDTALLAGDANQITSFELLDTFIQSYLDKENNYFRYSTGVKGTLPHLSGNIFIKNTGNPIKESEIKNYYNSYYPDLNIFVTDVTKSYTAKFIEILDNGQEYEWGVLKFDPETTTQPRLPIESDNIKPSKLNMTFKGWVDPKDPNNVLTDDDMKNYPFSNQNSVYTFYAYYEDATYEHKFHNQGSIIATMNTAYNQFIDEYYTIPVGYAADLGFYEKLTFVGWSTDVNKQGILSAAEAAEAVVDITTIKSTKPWDFYACYVREDVHATATDAKYLRFEPIDGSDAYAVGPSMTWNLKGKITLPVVTPEGATDRNGNPVPAGKPIGAIMAGVQTTDAGDVNFSHNAELQAIFWVGGPDKATRVTEVPNYAFYGNTNMVYFEMPINATRIGSSAFYNCYHLVFGDGENLMENKIPSGITTIGASAFQYAFRDSLAGKALLLPGSISTFETISPEGRELSRAFAYMQGPTSLEIGAEGDATQLVLANLNADQEIFEPNQLGAGITSAQIYVPAGTSSNWTGFTEKMRIGEYKYENVGGEDWDYVFHPATESVTDA